MKLNFQAIIKIIGINPYVDILAEQASSLKPNWKKPIPVLIRVNNQPKDKWHINLVPKGDGSYYLYLHEIVRKASKTKVGDLVNVEVEFDKEYKNGPMNEIPDQLKKFINDNPIARKNWEELSPSRQKEILRYLASLKSKEALDRNIEKVMYILLGNKARFMARDWENGK